MPVNGYKLYLPRLLLFRLIQKRLFVTFKDVDNPKLFLQNVIYCTDK